ncbi:Bug family tripartite tricarboxylate transporter substrate binding protein [Variovorax paradoxus]|uniref:Bug family tripartite tricarboxylate transporter substrate binding protein n=1 Tax=Variovorax paradoxus TaxID=34073 RepID=UPI00277E488E|nr:tripartite tricarboxylate transporter substrate-binding protein [Variovorax paradoxus]MDQ0587993.1 tripartite-type tricarboxylate transporter receptor subunit TctC [Variovorax paradoxus]
MHNIFVSRRSILITSAVAATFPTLIAAPSALAQSWPTRPITLIVPYAAGGNVDLMARWVAPELAKNLGQPVIVDNAIGAGGVIGTEKAVRSKPDGHTFLLSVESSIVIARLVTPSTVKYNGLEDLMPVTLLGSMPLVLVGKPELGPKSAIELFKDMKANPGKYSYATSGVGTSLHLGGELLKQQGGVSMVHVPYRVGAQIMSDLAGNQIDLAVIPLPSVMQQIQAGKIKGYGVLGPSTPFLPSTPSLMDIPQWKRADVPVWQGIFAPLGTDTAIIAKLDTELRKILATPEMQKKFDDGGVTRVGLGPKEFAAFLKGESAKFTQVVTRANIRAE